MKRTQIQLPDNVYERAQDTGGEWLLPKPRNLGWKGLSHAEIKEQAQLTSAEARLRTPGRLKA
jgi:hypothetical protein